MDELVKAIEKLTEEVKKLQAAKQEHHYHYHYQTPMPVYYYGNPRPVDPYSPYYTTTTCGITAQPAT